MVLLGGCCSSDGGVRLGRFSYVTRKLGMAVGARIQMELDGFCSEKILTINGCPPFANRRKTLLYGCMACNMGIGNERSRTWPEMDS